MRQIKTLALLSMVFLFFIALSQVRGEDVFTDDDLKDKQEWNFQKAANGEGEMLSPGVSKSRGEIREKKGRLSAKEKRERVRKRVEVMRMLRLTQELNLDEETAARFFARIRPIDQKRWELMKKKQELQRSMNKAGASDLTHQRDIQSLVDALKENRDAFEKLDDEEMEAVRELMTPPQQAKYLVFKERFSEEMKDRIKRAKQRKATAKPPNGRMPKQNVPLSD